MPGNRSRSSSHSSSRGECKNCSGTKDKWGGHLCLRHSPCIDHDAALWYPDHCDKCLNLLEDSGSKDQSVSSKARAILKELMRGAEAAATRKNSSGFVSQEVFALRFKNWMGTFNNVKSVRAEPLLPIQNQAPQVCASASSSKTLNSKMDLLSTAISEAQIQSDKELNTSMHLIDPPNSRSPQNPKPDQLAPRNRDPSQRRSRSPSQRPRKRSHHTSSPRMSSEKPPSKYSRHPRSRENSKSPSSSLHDEFEEFRRFKEQWKRERRSCSRAPSQERRNRLHRRHSDNKHRPSCHSPEERRLESRNSSRSSRERAYSRSPSCHSNSDEGSPSRSYMSEASPRSASPMDLRSDHCSRNLFGTDSEDESSPEPCPPIRASPSPSGGRPLTGHPTDEPGSDSHSAEEMRPDLTYYFMSSDTHLDEEGIVARDLPKVSRRCLHLAKKNNRQVVAFLDPSEYPALEYISRLSRVGSEKEQTPSQRDLLRSLNRIVQAGEKHNFGFDWKVEDHLRQDSEFVVNKSEVLEQYADVVSQAKGFGDEAKRPPLHPHVPLRTEGPKLQRLVSFLEAGSLSPTSHHLRKGYREGRTTREPSKVDRDIDHEYRRAARSALGIKLAWQFLHNIANLPSTSAQNKVSAFKAVVDAFQKDVDSNMDYQVTRAVHHRRNLIEFSTRDMPQADVRAAIQDLPLPAGPTLVHESAAETIQSTLQKPEGRQLAIIRDRPFKDHHRNFKQSSSNFQRKLPYKPSSNCTAPDFVPTRKPTRPARPSIYVSNPKAPNQHPGGNKPKNQGGNRFKQGQKQSKASYKPYKHQQSNTKKGASSSKH